MFRGSQRASKPSCPASAFWKSGIVTQLPDVDKRRHTGLKRAMAAATLISACTPAMCDAQLLRPPPMPRPAGISCPFDHRFVLTMSDNGLVQYCVSANGLADGPTAGLIIYEATKSIRIVNAGQYRQGLREGLFFNFHPETGHLVSTAYYSNGKLNGWVFEQSIDSPKKGDTLRTERQYRDGFLNGVYRKWQGNSIIEESEFDGGSLTAVSSFEHGALVARRSMILLDSTTRRVRVSSFMRTAAGWTKQFEGESDSLGRPDGFQRTWSLQGALLSEEIDSAGVIWDGPVAFDSTGHALNTKPVTNGNGVLLRVYGKDTVEFGRVDNGLREGRWIRPNDREPYKRDHANYHLGRLDGPDTLFVDHPEMIQTYANGVRTGPFVRLEQSGKVIDSIVLRNDFPWANGRIGGRNFKLMDGSGIAIAGTETTFMRAGIVDSVVWHDGGRSATRYANGKPATGETVTRLGRCDVEFDADAAPPSLTASGYGMPASILVKRICGTSLGQLSSSYIRIDSTHFLEQTWDMTGNLVRRTELTAARPGAWRWVTRSQTWSSLGSPQIDLRSSRTVRTTLASGDSVTALNEDTLVVGTSLPIDLSGYRKLSIDEATPGPSSSGPAGARLPAATTYRPAPLPSNGPSPASAYRLQFISGASALFGANLTMTNMLTGKTVTGSVPTNSPTSACALLAYSLAQRLSITASASADVISFVTGPRPTVALNSSGGCLVRELK
jgi:antitoxin component YwqK of YwqJK toxin-antitoxin module